MCKWEMFRQQDGWVGLYFCESAASFMLVEMEVMSDAG